VESFTIEKIRAAPSVLIRESGREISKRKKKKIPGYRVRSKKNSGTSCTEQQKNCSEVQREKKQHVISVRKKKRFGYLQAPVRKKVQEKNLPKTVKLFKFLSFSASTNNLTPATPIIVSEK
jgi:hypothetical protein